jgi:hypothetical protein
MDGWVMIDFLLFSPEAAGGARKRIIDHQPSASFQTTVFTFTVSTINN